MEADRIPTQQSELVQAASVSGNPPVADVRKEDQSNPCMVKDSGGRSAVHDYLGQPNQSGPELGKRVAEVEGGGAADSLDKRIKTAVEHGGGQKDPQYGEVEEKRAPHSQKVARTEVFDTKELMTEISSFLLLGTDNEDRQARALLGVCRAWQTASLWAGVIRAPPKDMLPFIGCRETLSWELLGKVPCVVAKSMFENMRLKRWAFVMAQLMDQVANVVNNVLLPNTFTFSKPRADRAINWMRGDTMFIRRVYNGHYTTENPAPFLSAVSRLPFSPLVPSTPTWSPPRSVAYAEVEVLMEADLADWGTRLAVGLVYRTGAFTLCTGSTWLGAPGSRGVSVAYTPNTKYNKENDCLSALPTGKQLAEGRFRAGDVIGVGLDVSNMCVFWTRGGLYMGVLADQETLLGLLRTALGSAEMGEAEARTRLPDAFLPAVTVRGPVKLGWRVGQDGYQFDILSYIMKGIPKKGEAVFQTVEAAAAVVPEPQEAKEE